MPGWKDPDEEQTVLVEILIPSAQAQLEGTFRDSDALDTKALGVLTLDAAALAVLIAVQNDINRFWWVPSLALAAAGGLLIAAIWPRQFDLGPDIEWFYGDLSAGTALDAARQMLAELLDSVESNDKSEKLLFFRWGLVAFAVALLGCLPVILIRPG